MEIYIDAQNLRNYKTCNLLHVHDIYVPFYQTNVFHTQFSSKFLSQELQKPFKHQIAN
jgi:hypothetical protein